ELTLQSLKYYRIAIDAMRVRKQRIQVHLGPVTNPDICVSIADFFMRVHDIAWAVVSGVCQGRLIIIVRNDGLRKDAGKLLGRSFSQMGTAGGHKTMARAEIPVANLEGVVQYMDDKAVSRWIIRRIDGHAK
ncbi:MAG TPA: phosphoesterase, partial [Desulfobacterales bacterium]|nr:phosphoesterase [Desulfobacterales bacterium]